MKRKCIKPVVVVDGVYCSSLMFADYIAMISFNVSLTNMPLVVSATMQEKDTTAHLIRLLHLTG